jgi:uncharacterized protein
MARKIGFARLSPEERAELGRRGGERANATGNTHRWTTEEAAKAARKRWRKKTKEEEDA